MTLPVIDSTVLVHFTYDKVDYGWELGWAKPLLLIDHTDEDYLKAYLDKLKKSQHYNLKYSYNLAWVPPFSYMRSLLSKVWSMCGLHTLGRGNICC